MNESLQRGQSINNLTVVTVDPQNATIALVQLEVKYVILNSRYMTLKKTPHLADIFYNVSCHSVCGSQNLCILHGSSREQKELVYHRANVARCSYRTWTVRFQIVFVHNYGQDISSHRDKQLRNVESVSSTCLLSLH